MRLRQVALVAEKLDPVVADLTEVLGLEVSFNDPGVDVFGLENAVIPVHGNFLEVVSPIQENTAGGRYLDRRNGDGGYMVMLQCDDAIVERERLTAMNIRAVFNIEHPPMYQATHFHPRDVGGFLLSIDSVEPGADWSDPLCSWHPAGPDWKEHVRTDVVAEMTGVELQDDNPGELAKLWSRILNIESAQNETGDPVIELTSGVIRFVKATDGRGTGVGGIDLKVADKSRLLEAAENRGCKVSENQVDIGGTRFYLV